MSASRSESGVIRVVFLTRAIGWYVAITVAFVASGSIFILPASGLRWYAAAIVVPVVAGCLVTTLLGLMTRVTVGSDGVLLEKLNRRRFVRFSDIAELDDAPDTMTLVLRNGLREVVTTNRARHARHVEPMFARIRDGITAHSELVAAPSAANALLLQVRALLSHDARQIEAYRDATLPNVSALWALASDPQMAIRTRAAAAVALHREEDVRVRLGTIAVETASPSLAALFHLVATGEDEMRILEALDDIGNDDRDAPISGASGPSADT